jgi:hypothetical protein
MVHCEPAAQSVLQLPPRQLMVQVDPALQSVLHRPGVQLTAHVLADSQSGLHELKVHPISQLSPALQSQAAPLAQLLETGVPVPDSAEAPPSIPGVPVPTVKS